MAKVIMVVGLLLTQQKVVLIQKNRPTGYTGDGRPEWQIGLLNGLGGVVKDGETPLKCLTRKVKAECGIDTVEKSWKLVNTLFDGEAEIQVYARRTSDGELKKLLSPTDESVGLYYINKLSAEKTIPNIQWLVPMAWISLNGEDNQVGVTGYNGTDISTLAPTAPTFYVVANQNSENRLSVLNRETYIEKGMANPIVFAGTIQEAGSFDSGFSKDVPYPYIITDGGKEVAGGISTTEVPTAKPREPEEKTQTRSTPGSETKTPPTPPPTTDGDGKGKNDQSAGK